MSEPQVKGAWLITTRRQILADGGEDALARVARRMGEEHAPALLEPSQSAWYPEVANQRAMAAVDEELCEGDPDRFVGFMEGCTVLGVNAFLRILLGLTSPAYLLSKMPTFWSRHRLHNGRLEVELGERSARMHYSGFPFFDDRNYRLMVRGVLRKSVEMTSGARPDVTVRDYGHDRLAVEVFFAKGAPPSSR